MKRLIAAVVVVFTMMAVVAPLTADAQRVGDSFTLPNGFTPEGIAIDGRTAYTGSLVDGSIQQIDIRTGATSQFAPSPGTGAPSIGMDTDRFGRLWVAGGGTAFFFSATPGYRVYDTDTGDLILDQEVASLGAAFMNDVIVTRDAAWFTDTFSPNLVKVPFDSRTGAIGEPELFTLGGDWVQNPAGPNANGIEELRNGRQLIVAQSAAADGNGAALYLIDTDTDSTTLDAQRIELDGPLAGADGLVLRGSSLYVVGPDPGVIEVKLFRNFTRGRISDEIAVDAASPTTADRVGNKLFVVDADFANFGNPEVSFSIQVVRG